MSVSALRLSYAVTAAACLAALAAPVRAQTVMPVPQNVVQLSASGAVCGSG